MRQKETMRCLEPGQCLGLRIRPAKLEFASEKAGEPLGLFLCGAPYPFWLLGKGFDLDDEPVSLALVAPDALHATIDQKHRREPALRAVHPAFKHLGDR